MKFVSTCLSHTSTLVKYVAHHSIRFWLNFSLIGRNVLYCSRRYGFDVSDFLTNNSRFISDTIHSYARSEVTEVQMHEVDLLFECILIRDGQAALPCWFPRWSDVQTIVNYRVAQKSKLLSQYNSLLFWATLYICTVWGCMFFCFIFCTFCVFCIIFRVPWYDLYNK